MIYGENSKGNLPKLYKFLSKGIPFPFGNWQNKRSILGIKNLQFVISHLLEKPVEQGCYILGDDQPISTHQMLKELFAGANKKLHIFNMPRSLVKVIIQVSQMVGVMGVGKLLGTLQVDNSKIKMALDIDELPVSTVEGLRKYGETLR